MPPPHAMFEERVVVPLPPDRTHRGISGSILSMDDGSLLFVHAIETNPLKGECWLESRRSRDDGRTWGDPFPPLPREEQLRDDRPHPAAAGERRGAAVLHPGGAERAARGMGRSHADPGPARVRAQVGGRGRELELPGLRRPLPGVVPEPGRQGGQTVIGPHRHSRRGILAHSPGTTASPSASTRTTPGTPGGRAATSSTSGTPPRSRASSSWEMAG